MNLQQHLEEALERTPHSPHVVHAAAVLADPEAALVLTPYDKPRRPGGVLAGPEAPE